MHPIERLRHLARLDPSRVDMVALGAAETLLGTVADPAELVVACRQLLARHPAAGPLWWVASSALTATDPQSALLDAVRLLEDDPTPTLAETVLAARPGAVGLDAWSFGEDGVFASAGAATDAEDAHAAGDRVVVIGGQGRGLPTPVWAAAKRGVAALPVRRPALVAWDIVEVVVGPSGPVSVESALETATCPLARELLGRRP